MPSLSFKSEGGKPVAFITVTKEEIKSKPVLKNINNQVIYLHDDNSGEKSLEFEDMNIFPLLKFKEGEHQNNRIAILAKSGAGKSHFVGRLLDTMKSKALGDPDREIVIISGVDQDAPLDRPRGKKGEKQPPERIDLNDPSLSELDSSDFENCIVVFDDIENLTNKTINKQVLNLRNSLLEKGRHKNIDVISISHNALGGNVTRFVHSESTACVVFPRYSQVHQLSTYLSKYIGLSKQAIEKIMDIGEHKSRWVYISNLAPTYIIYEHGIYLVK